MVVIRSVVVTALGSCGIDSAQQSCSPLGPDRERIVYAAVFSIRCVGVVFYGGAMEAIQGRNMKFPPDGMKTERSLGKVFLQVQIDDVSVDAGVPAWAH